METIKFVRMVFLSGVFLILGACGGDGGGGNDPPSPIIPASPAPEDVHVQAPFGDVRVGSISDLTIKLTSVGIGMNVRVLPVLPAPFSVVQDNCSSKLVFSSCTFGIRFAPTAAGPFSHSFDVPSDAANKVTISMSGAGVAGGSSGGDLPTAPTGVSATPGDGQVTILWNAVPGATSYSLYWDTASTKKSEIAKVTSVTSPFIHTGLTNGIEYRYVIQAENANGKSADSIQVVATPTLPMLLIPVIGSKAQGLTFDASGTLYISSESGKVVKLEGGTLSTFIPKGSAGLNFGKHIRFSQGYFYVNNVLNAGTNLDAGVDEVLLFNEAGVFVRKLITEANDTSNIFHFEDITVNARGQLYMGGFGLLSSSPKQVVRIDANGENFKVLPLPTAGAGRIGAPTSVAVDSQGNLYVGDFGLVSKFDAEGVFLQNIVERGVGNSGFESSTHVAIDREDNLYIGDLKGAESTTPAWNILKFNSSGVFQGEFIPSGAGGLSSHPEDIGFDSQGFLYIADEGAGGVIRFTPTGNFDQVIAKNFGEGDQGGNGGGGGTGVGPSPGIYTCWTWTLFYDQTTLLLLPWLEPSVMGVIEIQDGQQYRIGPLHGASSSGTFQLDTKRGRVTFTGGGLNSLVAALEHASGADALRFRFRSPQNPGDRFDFYDDICVP